MRSLRHTILLFAVLFAVFVLGPPLLGRSFGPYPLMKTADVFDLLTPLVLIPLYWLLFNGYFAQPATRAETLCFLVLSALWVEGQGMHLAANSIGHLAESLVGTDLAVLTHFYDEVLSHYMWHAAMMGLDALLIVRQWRNPFVGRTSNLGTELGAGILHGLNYALMVLEGTTTLIGVPFAAVAVLSIAGWGRRGLRQTPVVAFFLFSLSIALLLMVGWMLYWGGPVEPCSVLGC